MGDARCALITNIMSSAPEAISDTRAHFLASQGHSVTILDADGSHVDAIHQRGIVLVNPVTHNSGAVIVTAAYTPTEADAVKAGLPRRVPLATKSQVKLRSLVDAGRRSGIASPHSVQLERLLGQVETGNRSFGRHNLVELASMELMHNRMRSA